MQINAFVQHFVQHAQGIRMQSIKNSVLRLCAAAVLVAVASANPARADSVSYSFDDVVIPPSVTMAGTAPWLSVQIADTATAGTVVITVTANLIGAQTLTGIWLNLAPSVASALTSFALDPLTSGTGVDPFAFAPIDTAGSNTQSRVDTTQDFAPTGATRTQVGFYNILLRFPNSGSGSFQTTETETFSLVANASSGLNASSFLQLSSPTAAGNPNPSFYALASFTNANGLTGTPGSGVAYIAAVTAVPEGGAGAMLLAGLGVLTLVARRRA